MNEPENLIGDNVSRLRRLNHLSQRQLADLMRTWGSENWHQNTVSRVEKSIQKPDLQEIGHLVTILGTEVLDGTIEAEILRQTGGWYATQSTERAFDNIRRKIDELQDEVTQLEKLLRFKDKE